MHWDSTLDAASDPNMEPRFVLCNALLGSDVLCLALCCCVSFVLCCFTLFQLFCLVSFVRCCCVSPCFVCFALCCCVFFRHKNKQLALTPGLGQARGVFATPPSTLEAKICGMLCDSCIRKKVNNARSTFVVFITLGSVKNK